MNMHESFASLEEIVCGKPASRASWLGSMRARFAELLKGCADFYAAAAAYDDLSRLSDLQLKHRGSSRDILARDLSEWRDQASGKLTSTRTR